MQQTREIAPTKKRSTTVRNSLNKRLPRMGRVVFSDHSNAVHCTVRSFSEESAVLSMSGWMGVPSEFLLYVEPDNIRAKCLVSQRKGSNVQVRFTEIETDMRYRAAV